jgi:hypothetical protein
VPVGTCRYSGQVTISSIAWTGRRRRAMPDPRDGPSEPTLGAPRIHGELLKLGFDVSEPTISRPLPRGRTPPSQTWRTFLENHLGSTV